ncbi:MAG: sodium:solute symporter family transporter, partial [Planctomycetota bacterium]
MDIHSSLTMIDYTVILIYIIILLALGFWVSFRKKHTKDIFLAGNTLGWPNVGLSIFGTNVSPTMMIASCGIAYSSGMVAANFEWLAWIFLMLLGMVYFPRYMNMKISTMPEFLEKRFGKPCRHFLTWYTMLGIIITWLGGSLYAGGILLVQIFDWPLWVCLAFLILISTSFTVTGGLAAVVITDSFQSILIIVTSAALTVIGLVKVGGVSGLIEAAPEGYWTLFRPSDAPIYPWYVIVLGYPVMSIWFWCADQTIVQRVLGAKDLRNGQLGTVFAGFIKIITPLIFLVPGILCFVLHPGLDNSDKAYMTMVTSYFPTGLIGLIIAVLIAALVSTVDSGLNSMSTVFTLDFYCKKLRPEAQRKETILVGRIVTILTAFIAFFVSWSMSFAGKNL